MPWLRLIRWNNLLIIFLTQLLAWWCVILPESPRVLNTFNFILLSASTMLIAAAGYIINDYFDVSIDAINKPERVVLETIIPRKQAIIAHTVLNIAGIALAAVVALRGGHLEWLLIQAGCTLLLWFYSTDFKRQYVTGNVVVSLLTSLTVLTLLIYEPALRHTAGKPQLDTGTILSKPGWVLIIYAYFAFMLTWIREIVKDMEDLPGDQAAACQTMPLKKGLKFATQCCSVLAVLVIIPLVVASYLLVTHHDTGLPVYISGLLLIPLAIWTWQLGRGTTTGHYHRASTRLKLIMLLGIFSLVVYHYQLFLKHAS